MNENPTPVISPIIALLKSRKALVALITAVINLLIPFAPGLEAHRDDLLTISLVLTPVIASVLIAAIAHEDASAAAAKEAAKATTVIVPPGVSSPER